MFPDLNRRSLETELMDAELFSLEDFDICLRQIEKVNGLTLGYRPVFLWLKEHLSLPNSHYPLTIMDVGCGRGEMLRMIWRLARKKNINIRLIGIDINPLSKLAAERATPGSMDILYQTANIFEMHEVPKADLIVCSHVAHHLRDDELVRFLRWLDRHSLKGWFIVDLHRHFVPLFLTKQILALAPVNPIVRHDGPASVRRARTADEWRQILRQADIGPSQYSMRWFFPFRYGIAG